MLPLAFSPFATSTSKFPICRVLSHNHFTVTRSTKLCVAPVSARKLTSFPNTFPTKHIELTPPIPAMELAESSMGVCNSATSSTSLTPLASTSSGLVELQVGRPSDSYICVPGCTCHHSRNKGLSRFILMLPVERASSQAGKARWNLEEACLLLPLWLRVHLSLGMNW